MRNLTTELKVGLLILGGLGVIVYSSVLVTGWQPGQGDTYRVGIVFDNAAGLLAGTPAQVAGIKVGQVEHIDLEEGRALVMLRIYSQYTLRRDARATIRSLGILGDKYIELTLGSPGQPPLRDGERVVFTTQGRDLDSLVDGVSVILEDIRTVTASLRDALGTTEGRQRLNTILDQVAMATQDLSRITAATNARIDTILDSFAGFSQTLERIGNDNEQDIHATLANLAAFSKDLAAITARNRESLDAIIANLDTFSRALASDGPDITADLRTILRDNKESLNRSIVNLEHSFSKLDKTMSHVESVSAKLDRGEGSLGKLLNDERTVDELNQALAGLNRYITEAERIKLDLGFEADYLASQGEFKSYFNIKLQPLKDRWYTLQLVDNPRGKITKRTVQTTTGGTTTVTDEVETTQELQFSLLLAQRYYDTVLKGGIMESDVGAGIEQLFGSRDQFRIGLDVWDFGGELGPHVKASAYWRFFSNAFLVVGGDDLASKQSQYRDAFFGIGVNFNEDNLKPLMSSLPLTEIAKP
ncbi:MAG: MCE family protein [Candidatus Lambdaproteobacteria bacterium]|nr:MCE family protein [Candidatus Lambdaproteobacteria bacterium]